MLELRNLARLSYANDFTLWSYKSYDDTIDAMLRPRYFDGAAGMLKLGDTIIAVSIFTVSQVNVAEAVNLVVTMNDGKTVYVDTFY